MRVFPLVLLLLTACGPRYKLAPKQKSCASSFVEREYDLALKVDQGPGDGTFDYPLTDWPLLDRTHGAFDLHTGDFWWENTYAADAVRLSERAEGGGSIKRSGDLDLDYGLTVAWKDGGTTQWAYRHTRTGCAETLRREAVDIELTDFSWAGGAADYLHYFVEGPVAVEGVGRIEANRSWYEVVDFKKGGVQVSWLTEGDGNGHQTRTFDDDNGVAKSAGSWERWYDGTVAMDFTYNHPGINKQTWEFSVDSAGAGGGSWSTADDSCEIVFNKGNCKLKNCSNPDIEGQCTVPVTWPLF